MKPLPTVHARFVFSRRVRRLADLLAATIPPDASVLDVGCGDGSIAAAIGNTRPDVTISGVDVLVRPETHIPVLAFDGVTLPFDDRSFDVVLAVDVLHHTDDPAVLLREMQRVARRLVVLKDHVADGPFAVPTLRFMDWVGNAHHGVRLPYNYLRRREWDALVEEVGLRVTGWNGDVGLYPAPLSWVFDRGLHMVATLVPAPGD